ncbi:trypsin-like serine peptidase [Kineococcus sp. SYSU DK003]|uniref:trypsin-like serine peptidase n=1 Tax=Kineococcus sp. SYSU DK003 TaxID=3383124 RepID=UPI003D7C49F7
MRRPVSATSTGALALAAALTVSGVTLTGAAAASAVPVTPSTGADSAVSLLSTVDESAQQAALDYWTPERMAAAEPAQQVVEQAQGSAQDSSGAGAGSAQTLQAPSPQTSQPEASTLADGDAPAVARGTRTTAGVVTGDAVSTATTWTGEEVAAVGRLYFSQAGRNYECTASSVDSPQGNVLVTAGHCLTENGVASENVVFVPGLAGSTKPYGQWSVTKMFTTTQWKDGDQTSAAALNHDVGFAQVAPSGGRSLQEAVGSFGIDFTDQLSRVTVFGYPGRSTNADGFTLQYCTGWQFTDAVTADSTTDRAVLCSMAGGSSGGPWVRDFDQQTRSGTVTSVVSFSYNNAPEVLYGPLFGDTVEAVYEEALA